MVLNVERGKSCLWVRIADVLPTKVHNENDRQSIYGDVVILGEAVVSASTSTKQSNEEYYVPVVHAAEKRLPCHFYLVFLEAVVRSTWT